MKKLLKKGTWFLEMKNIHFRFIMLLLVSFLSMKISAQDKIILRNETEESAKITEINATEVKYKKFNNLNGPTYTLLKSEIQMIKYENGSQDTFEQQETGPNTEAEASYVSVPNGVDPKNTDLIITRAGLNINCVIDFVENDRISYHIINRGRDIKEIIYLANVSEYIKQNAVKKVGPVVNNEASNDDRVEIKRHYSGPRVGMTFVGPGAFEDALKVENKRNFYSQFGWQFETRMFTLENGLSGMLEFVPLMGGIDMGKLIPSFSGLIGLRTRNGAEFGIGPNWGIYSGKDKDFHHYTTSNLGIVIVAGMSIKSGKVYFPINIAVVPSVTKQAGVYDPKTNKTIVQKYQTGTKVSLLIGFNNRSR